ncbi:unnamed protein product [Nesidiocoris tenuis]|uniref:Uncharacterized protein n=1 Tax=Nesidiocoris tenuis TaxID=355587 RepID=A0A6H5HNM7_9HEMI|nr:unnamed protein product [Nesidiocoris tenuis]
MDRTYAKLDPALVVVILCLFSPAVNSQRPKRARLAAATTVVALKVVLEVGLEDLVDQLLLANMAPLRDLGERDSAAEPPPANMVLLRDLGERDLAAEPPPANMVHLKVPGDLVELLKGQAADSEVELLLANMVHLKDPEAADSAPLKDRAADSAVPRLANMVHLKGRAADSAVPHPANTVHLRAVVQYRAGLEPATEPLKGPEAGVLHPHTCHPRTAVVTREGGNPAETDLEVKIEIYVQLKFSSQTLQKLNHNVIINMNINNNKMNLIYSHSFN